MPVELPDVALIDCGDVFEDVADFGLLLREAPLVADALAFFAGFAEEAFEEEAALGPVGLLRAGWLVAVLGAGRGVVRCADPGALGSGLVVVAIYYLAKIVHKVCVGLVIHHERIGKSVESRNPFPVVSEQPLFFHSILSFFSRCANRATGIE